MSNYLLTDKLLEQIQTKLISVKHKHQDCQKVESEDDLTKTLSEILDRLNTVNNIYVGE